jgi:3-dehydroquinate synthase
VAGDLADEREPGGRAGAAEDPLAAARIEAGRLALNLGHSLGHGFEAAAGYGDGLLHGEAVAYGLRAACRIGVALGVTPADRADRIERLLTALELAPAGGLHKLGLNRPSVLQALGADKKHAGGRLRWVLPTADFVTVRTDVPAELIERVTGELLEARP